MVINIDTLCGVILGLWWGLAMILVLLFPRLLPSGKEKIKEEINEH